MAVPPAVFRPQKSAVMMQTPSGAPRGRSDIPRSFSHLDASSRIGRGTNCAPNGPLHAPYQSINRGPAFTALSILLLPHSKSPTCSHST